MKPTITLLLAALLLTGVALFSHQHEQQARDEEAIKETIQHYFDGVMQYDADLLREAFHPDAQVMASFPGSRRSYYNGSFSAWLQFTKGEAPTDVSGYANTIVSIDIAGTAAIVKTDLTWPEVHYIDYLSLLKLDGEWQIVGKIWHQERK